MSTASVLLNYAGYPISLRNFVPDNGMASLAGALLERGHRTVIFDYSTVDIIRRIYPSAYRDRIGELTGRLMGRLKDGAPPDRRDLEDFYRLDAEVDRYQQERVTDIAREVDAYVKEHGIDFVGMKLFLGDAFEGTVAIAEYLRKRNPGLRIFGGGPHVDWFMDRLLSMTDAFDALAYGEGEETIVLLAEYAEGKRRLEEIPNLVFKKGGRTVVTPVKRVEDLERLPNPVYDTDVYPAMRGDEKIKILLVDESRGCPNACSFCCHPAKSGGRWRMRDHVRVVDFMEEMGRKHGITAFRFAGSNPPPVLKRRIGEEILRRGLRVKYTAFSHVRAHAGDDYRLMRRSGCFATFFGIESGSPEILSRSMNKRIDPAMVRSAVAACRETGMQVVCSVIYPAPFEDERTRRETLDLLLEIEPDSTDVCFPTPVPGTRWGDRYRDYSFDLGDEERFWRDTMTYRLKTYYPQVLWKPHPNYRLNGRDFSQTAAATTDFVQEFERRGLLTQVTDEVLLMAHCAGMAPREFRDVGNTALSSGDGPSVRALVARVNRGVQSVESVPT